MRGEIKAADEAKYRHVGFSPHTSVVSNTRQEILVSYSTDRGLSWTTSVRQPVYEVAVATPQPVHSGTICSSGTTYQIGGTDRRLGDYHTNAVTADGTFVIAYPDTSFKPQGAISHPEFVAQAGGVDFVVDRTLGG